MTRYRAAPSGHHYHVEIRGAGEKLALLHGFSGGASTWREVAARLMDDFQLILIDLLGHGGSDAPADVASYRMAAVAADIVDIITQLGVGKPRLLGYSMGGRLALYLGLRYPRVFHSLILESASPGLADEASRAERRERDNMLADQIEANGIAFFVDYWERLPLWSTQSEALTGAQRAQRSANNPLGLANSLRGLGLGAQPNLWGQLPNLALPTCLIVGERDDKFRRINQAMNEALPRASLSIISQAGHNSHLEQPEAFCREVKVFLDRL